jgi:hypothetical protein
VIGVDDVYRRSRRALLDALEALVDHRDGVTLIGAHAVYIYTGEDDVPIVTRTKDSDLALDPELLREDPLLEEAMEEAGFHRNLDTGQPGEWLSTDGIPVDLLVPTSMVPSKGRRSVQIPPHSPYAARKVGGLEAAVVDNRTIWIEALDPGDPRRIQAKVAGPAALCVTKAHQLGERQASPRRLVDKDAHDLYRLLAATETAEVAAGFQVLLGDPRSHTVAEQALTYLADLFNSPESLGSVMAGRAEGDLDRSDIVAASVSALVGDLLTEVEPAPTE